MDALFDPAAAASLLEAMRTGTRSRGAAGLLSPSARPGLPGGEPRLYPQEDPPPPPPYRHPPPPKFSPPPRAGTSPQPQSAGVPTHRASPRQPCLRAGAVLAPPPAVGVSAQARSHRQSPPPIAPGKPAGGQGRAGAAAAGARKGSLRALRAAPAPAAHRAARPHPRRLSPRQRALDGQGLRGGRLRGQPRAAAGGAPPQALRAARRGLDAALVRLRRHHGAARSPGGARERPRE